MSLGIFREASSSSTFDSGQMPDCGRVLEFRPRPTHSVVTAEEAALAADAYLRKCEDVRDETALPNADTLLALCKLLREQAEIAPGSVAKEAANLYRRLDASTSEVGLFDEREYLKGEAALIAGFSLRFLGEFAECERWFDRAEANFRHTINPAPLLANVAFARLAYKFATSRFDEVLELVPSLISSFGKMGMGLESAKARFLMSATLHALGNTSEACRTIRELASDASTLSDVKLHAKVLVHLGNYLSALGRFDEAAITYRQALPVAKKSQNRVIVAELKWSIGDTCRSQNRLVEAVESFASAAIDYAALDMKVHLSRLRLVTAEVLLSLGLERQAEWEVLAAILTIEEQKMVPEGFAAFALLKESVRRRKTDAKALRELREHLTLLQ